MGATGHLPAPRDTRDTCVQMWAWDQVPQQPRATRSLPQPPRMLVPARHALALPLLLSLLATAAVNTAPCVAMAPSPDPTPSAAAVVTLGPARLTVLTPSLVRLQLNASLPAQDAASFTVINRALPVPRFTVAHPNASAVVITTSAHTAGHIHHDGWAVTTTAVVMCRPRRHRPKGHVALTDIPPGYRSRHAVRLLRHLCRRSTVLGMGVRTTHWHHRRLRRLARCVVRLLLAHDRAAKHDPCQRSRVRSRQPRRLLEGVAGD